MTLGQELKGGGNVGRRGCAGLRGITGEKWDNCNIIINKIYFKNKYFIPKKKMQDSLTGHVSYSPFRNPDYFLNLLGKV